MYLFSIKLQIISIYKIQKFVDSLKNDAKTEDTKIKDLNEKLIAEGEKISIKLQIISIY